METYEIKCGGCGKKLLTYSRGHFRRYKSPVKTCKKCGRRYADPRCHEIAIEGIPSDTFSIPSYLILTLFGAFILYRGIRLSGMRQLGAPDAMQWIMPTVFCVLGFLMTFGGIAEIVTIVTGLKAGRFDRLRAESEKRLEDKSYVYTLRQLGYAVPEKYL